MNELRAVWTALADRLADVIAPVPRHARLMADMLAAAEADYDVYEPVGEYPDLPPNVPAGVEHGDPLRRSTGGHPSGQTPPIGWQEIYAAVADVIHAHRLDGVMCACTIPFATGEAHALHVARLVLDAV